MRHFFSAGHRLKARAQKSLDSGLAQIKKWWSDRYKLPPNHELFLSMSVAEHTQEMYEDLMIQREDVRRSLERGDGDRKALLEQLTAVERALGDDAQVEDELVDQWERDLEEGRIPDLEAM